MFKKSEKELERCVLCGKPAEYTKDKPIAERIGYIEGSGQLCRICFAELYGNEKSKIKMIES